MSIIPTWSTFRSQFASGEIVTHAPALLGYTAPDRIVVTSGDLVALGYVAGMRVQITGPTIPVGNEGPFIIDSLISTTEIETVEQTIVTNANTAGRTLTGQQFDPDGVERWPVANMRAGGFTGGVTGMPIPYVFGLLITLTVNAGVADSVLNVDEYDWYLSQRTDEVSSQYLSMTEVPPGASSFSGSVRLVTSTVSNVLGIVDGPITPPQTALLFNKAHLYVRRKSDDAIQLIDLYGLLTKQP